MEIRFLTNLLFFKQLMIRLPKDTKPTVIIMVSTFLENLSLVVIHFIFLINHLLALHGREMIYCWGKILIKRMLV